MQPESKCLSTKLLNSQLDFYQVGNDIHDVTAYQLKTHQNIEKSSIRGVFGPILFQKFLDLENSHVVIWL